MKTWLVPLIFTLFTFWTTAQSIEEDKTTSQTEVISKQKIKVFPNPATNVVNILGLKNSSRADIVISDISGNIVLKHQWAIRKNAVSIPIPNLRAGIYVARIESEEQQVQAKFYKN
ncbi:T9SS type A sorting domain-containing protein [Maribacter algarum]|uniref:T9SS type A sorting domain-containing protein n=1 Tax=Maribacter algarum (ex Zhang et al. 2020) TaxID=2578118 RepID=A0A5S3PTP2_9FLAO|nr:T9SS type A sorting domain-containing protein [Maribacter algarum]TMM58300.1 T9SS type A sorting domain-containing protein [Maribacter algarum]